MSETLDDSAAPSAVGAALPSAGRSSGE